MHEDGYLRLAISLERENIRTREGSATTLTFDGLDTPDFCISRRTRAKVLRTSVEALGTYRKVGSRIDFMGPPMGSARLPMGTHTFHPRRLATTLALWSLSRDPTAGRFRNLL